MKTVLIKVIFPEHLDLASKEEELKEILINLTHSLDNYNIKNGNSYTTFLKTECLVKVK